MSKVNDSLQYYVYNTIKSKILNCEILPGAKIDEDEILEMSGSSKTPFREAMIRLKSEGLVEVKARYGFYATNLTEDDINEVFRLRKLFEPEIALHYFERADINKLIAINNEMKKLSETSNFKTFSPTTMTELDFNFHSFFVNCSESHRLKEIFKPLLRDAHRITMLNHLFTHSAKPWDSAIKQHEDIISALLSEDRNKIHQAFNVHLNYYKAKAFSSISRKP